MKSYNFKILHARLLLFLFIIISPYLCFSQKLNSIQIDELTRQPDKPFPFDEPFSIVYKYNKNLPLIGVSYMMEKKINRDSKNLKELTYKDVKAKKKEEKNTLNIFMPPLPPGKRFDIVLIYEGNPKIQKQLDSVNESFSKLTDTQKTTIDNYIKLEKSLRLPNSQVPAELINIKQSDLLNFFSIITGIETSGLRTVVINQLLNENKILSAAEKGQIKAFISNNTIDDLAILQKINSIMNDGYRVSDIRTMQFPNVESLVKILEVTSSILTSDITSINTYVTALNSIQGCCKEIMDCLKKDSTLYNRNKGTIARISEISNTYTLSKILTGEIPFVLQKKKKSTDSLIKRKSNINTTIDLLWNLRQDLSICKECNSGGCTAISNLDKLIEVAIVQKEKLEKNLQSLNFLYFEWIDGNSLAANYKTQVNNIIKSDIGIAHIMSNNNPTVRPYYGVNINFRSVRNDVLFGSITSKSGYIKPNLCTWLLYHTSIDLGVTVGSLAIPEIREDLYLNSNVLVGLSYRIPKTGVRFSYGRMIYQKVDPNPLINDTDIASLPYWSLKFDLDIQQAASAITSFLFN